MDLTPTTKSPETESAETATRIHPAKHLTFTNGVLKRHHHQHHGHHPITITYKECLKNHAASLGGHALDGCGEFMPSPTATTTDPTSLKCAACGCHRNFHRREPDDPPFSSVATTNAANTTATIEYQPHHRHHPLPPPQQPSHRSPNSSSPPPISSSYYPSAPHMLLALSGNLQSGPENVMNNSHLSTNTRKRFRTKFSQTQKEKMLEFAEKVGWKMQKRDEEMVQEFCNEVGVDRTVLKVWMHNNKNTFGRRDGATANGGGSGGGGGGERIILDNTHNNESNENNGEEENNNDNDNNNIVGQNLNHQFENESLAASAPAAANANGSSSS